MKSEVAFSEVMDKLKNSVKKLKEFADETGADIDNYSLDFKLYLEYEEQNNLHLTPAEKRKRFFEEKSKKDQLTR